MIFCCPIVDVMPVIPEILFLLAFVWQVNLLVEDLVILVDKFLLEANFEAS
jgi:hypothetical protein